MRKFIIVLIIILCCTINNRSVALASSQYAQAIKSANLYRLDTNSDRIEDILCLVEKTYFVEIISDNGDNYKVNYNGINGFVKKEDVKEITSHPSTPYPYNIKLVIGSTCNLRSTPKIQANNNNVIATINTNESDIQFIGRIFADEAIDFGGTTWYYVKYQDNYGYIYNKYVKSITPIYANTEQVSFKSDKIANLVNPITHTPSLLLIIIMFIPCLIILLILYLPRKYRTHKKPKKSKVIERY